MTENLQIPASHSGVRERLRGSTHHHHSQLNRNPMLAGLTKPLYPLAKYRDLLTAYFYLYQALEQQITAFLAQQFDLFNYAERRKLPWLEADFSYFKLDLPGPEVVLRGAVDLPKIETVGQLIGVLYVIEGSTLGGQLISRSLAEHHGLTSGQGASFFGGYGDRTMPLWESYIRFAESIAGNEVECRAAEAAAGSTFQLFEQALDDIGRLTASLSVVIKSRDQS